ASVRSIRDASAGGNSSITVDGGASWAPRIDGPPRRGKNGPVVREPSDAGRRVTDQARVVIIGGGIAGCSLAYHLAHQGWTDLLLLDKGELTSGSTWHAAGMVTHFHTSPTLMRMRKYSIDLYRRLQAQPRAAEHWHEGGSLRLASHPPQLPVLPRHVRIGP